MTKTAKKNALSAALGMLCGALIMLAGCASESDYDADEDIRYCTVTFYPNPPAGTDEAENLSPQKWTFTSGVEQQLPDTYDVFATTIDGYHSIGWTDDPNSTQVSYLAGSNLAVYEDMNLYAVWESLETVPDTGDADGDSDMGNVNDNPDAGDASDDSNTGDVNDNGLIIKDNVVVGFTENISANLVIPDGITAIKEHAFYNCSNLITVSIPDTVTNIGIGAFFGCTNLDTVVLPKSIKEIKDSTFSTCWSLANIEIPYGTESIEEYAFYGCGSLTKIDIPATVTSIGNSALAYTGLRTFTVPASVTSSWWHVLYGSANLESVIFENGVTNIESNFSQNCPNLREFTIPATVISIGKCAFHPDSDSSVRKITVDVNAVGALNTYLALGNDPFSNKSLAIDLLVINGTGSMNAQLYSGKGIKAIEICDGVTGSLPDYAFFSCAALEKITIPESITGIGEEAFSSCSSLTNFPFSNVKGSIGKQAFYYCPNLTDIYIPENITDIGEEAFYYCEGLKTVSISNTGNIGKNAFSKCTNLETALLSNVGNIEHGAFSYCKNLAEVTFSKDTKIIGSSAFYYCESLKKVTIPEGVINIEDGAFSGCKSLASVDIPKSITSIGHTAFSYSGFQTIDIPKSVTSIGDYAFSYSELQTIDIPDSVEVLGIGAFSSCTSLETCIIGKGITKINYWTFEDCPKVTIIFKSSEVPSFVIHATPAIGAHGAFGACTTPEQAAVVTNTVKVPAGTAEKYKYGLKNYPNLNIIEY